MRLSLFNTPKQPKQPKNLTESRNAPSNYHSHTNQNPSNQAVRPIEDSNVPGQNAGLRTPTPLDSSVISIQQQILERLFLVTIIAGIIIFASSLATLIQESQWLVVGFYGLIFVCLIIAAFLRRLAIPLRAAVLLIGIIVLGVSTILTYGHYGAGQVFLFALPFFAALLTGKRGRTASLVLSIGGVSLTSALIATGPFAQLDARLGLGEQSFPSIFVGVIIFSLLVIGGSVSTGFLLDGFKKSLEHQNIQNHEIADERALLEDEIDQRTDELQRRLVQIRTAAEINRAISRMLDIDQLLPEVCTLVSQRFGLYYVGIFLIDESTSQGQESVAALKAGTGEAGRQMLLEGHRLAVGGDSMIGWATANRKPRIAQNVGQEVVRFNNPHLPLTRSELALPILIYEGRTDVNLQSHGRQSERILGAMTIQSSEESAFDQDDILILQGIADSLASAIENSRLFAATEASLEEIRTLHRQYLEQAWQKETALHGEINYSFDSGDTTQHQSPSESILEVPIRLRDQVIGSLILEHGQNSDLTEAERHGWSSDDIMLVETVANQAALALENARLLEETRRKANLERTATDITSKMWASVNIEAILHTALQELSHTLGAREGWIELRPGEYYSQPAEIVENALATTKGQEKELTTPSRENHGWD
jgi:GAF domain-containing protein